MEGSQQDRNTCYNISSKVKDELNAKKAVDVYQSEKHANKSDGHVQVSHPMSYGETLMHLLRGNIGAGMFGMGDAYRNGGIIFSPIATVCIALICVHNQHILVRQCRKMREIQEEANTQSKFDNPDFAETVELCFANGPSRIRSWSKFVKFVVNLLICVTQLGFCCVYFVFISSSLEQLWKIYMPYEWNYLTKIVIILLPIALISCITDLKYLAPISTIANVSMGAGLALTLYYAAHGLPNISERRYVGDLEKLPLFLGTTIFAFEGISLVLPLRNVMKKPKLFSRPLGVLNLGMVVVSTLLACCGFLGYWRWGEQTEGSLTLNLPKHEPLAQTVKLMVAVGILLTYPLQFFVAIQIMWSSILEKVGPIKYPTGSELLFRMFFVLFTYMIAELVPLLNLCISLIGSMCSTSLALLLPPLIELVSEWGLSTGPTPQQITKNCIVILIGAVCFVTGTYESVRSLVFAIMNGEDH